MDVRTLHVALWAVALASLPGCPSTTACPEGEVWNGSMCVAAVDVGPFDGGRDASGEDAPCGGGCTAPLICNVDNNECVACLGTDASSCGAGQNACVDNTCVACDDDADCEALDAAQCDTTTNTCVACTGSAACAGRTGTEVCNAGTCVECSADDESACTAGVCDVAMGSCTTLPARVLSPCRACVNDRQCAEGQLCVPTRFPAGGGAVVGNHCAWRQDAAAPGPAGDCFDALPYVRSVMETSVNGVSAQVCVPRVSTCEALADFGGTACTPPGTTANPMCGVESVDDGFCAMVSAGTNRCTVECSSTDDCPCTGGTCARQYRCSMGFCDLGCECAVGGGACTGTCP